MTSAGMTEGLIARAMVTIKKTRKAPDLVAGPIARPPFGVGAEPGARLSARSRRVFAVAAARRGLAIPR
jgi:hypothetical protein